MERKKVAKENHYFSEKTETMSREEMKQLQFEKTRDILSRAYSKSDFYRNHFDQAKVKPEHFKTLEDIARFPFIEKQDVVQDQVEHPPYGKMICSPPDEIRRINQTSGTSGMGQEVHCHDEDAIWAANASTAEHFAAIGLEKGNLSAVLYPLGPMTGGILSYEALRMFGAIPLALGVYDTNQKIEFMRRFNSQHILTTPAYLTRITSIMMERGLNPAKEFLDMKGITLSTEPFSIQWALRMEEIWGTVIHDIYGSTQLNLNYGITCKYGAVPDGEFGCYHLTDAYTLVEVLDKDTDQPVNYGEWGEPVVTTFSRKAMPLIRFRTNDRVRLLPPGFCDCGRNSSGMWEVGTISRYDDMIKIKATNVWPQTVDEAVFSFDEIDEYNGRVYITSEGQEVAGINLEFKNLGLNETTKATIVKKIGERIKELTQVNMKVDEVPHGTLPRFEYKVRRWTDDRVEGLDQVKYIEKS